MNLPSWRIVTKFDRRAAHLADGHYSRRTVGSPQFMPPGETLVLLTDDGSAVFGWWRPHPASGLKSMNGLDGWTCTIFRYVDGVPGVASKLILSAETKLRETKRTCGPDGLLTYVFDRKIRSVNPGFCFKIAGWRRPPLPIRPRSGDKKKTLLWKPFDPST